MFLHKVNSGQGSYRPSDLTDIVINHHHKHHIVLCIVLSIINGQPSHLESRPQQHQPASQVSPHNNGQYQQSPRAESQAQSPRNNSNNSQRFSQYQNESPAPPLPEASVNGYNEKQSGRTVTSSYIQQTSHAQPAYGRKRAVVCGVSYLGQKSSLEASISDARSVKDFLVKNMRFPDASILLLTEDEVDPGYQRGVSFIFLPLKLQ
ncbi:hypothetical protein POM88_001600 [Heracleum sosnowskyi]|uniref:Uncharacterized protein n=1 Tax=Heracleum sosnowskyi TaxID=360622 RepID=A0AAD8JGF4_9APIA|nr:hypothetical protein POM88_001600 [Heracleum sosnowskyi]